MNGQNFGDNFNKQDMAQRNMTDYNNVDGDPDEPFDKESMVTTFPEEQHRENTEEAYDAGHEEMVPPVETSEAAHYNATVVKPVTLPALPNVKAGLTAALFDSAESEHFRTRWNEVQGEFVDEPRSAVQQADVLVSELIEKITVLFKNERGSLEEQWKTGNDVSTEDLRKALQRYRSFFNRLVGL